MSKPVDPDDKGYLTKQKKAKPAKEARDKNERFQESRHLKTGLKKYLEEIERDELEHDEDDNGVDYSQYIK